MDDEKTLTKTRTSNQKDEKSNYEALKAALKQKASFINEVRDAFLNFKAKLDLYRELFNEVPAEFDVVLRSEIPMSGNGGRGGGGKYLCLEFFPTGKDKDVKKVEATGWAKFGEAIQEALDIPARHRKTIRWHADWKALKGLILSHGYIIKAHNIEA